MDVCRVCLSPETDMIPLHESFVENYNILTNLNVKMYDDLPQFTCKNCSQNVNSFMEFREKSISSETALRKILHDLKREVAISNDEAKQLKLSDNILNMLGKEIKHETYDDEHINDTFDNKIEDALIDCKDLFIKIRKNEVNTVKRSKKLKASKKIKLKLNNNKPLLGKLLQKIKEENPDELLCGLCKLTFENTEELNEHLEKHFKDKQCSICNEVAKSWAHLLGHRLRHVPVKQKRCHMCNKRFVGSHYLEFHYNNEHFGEVSKVICSYCSTSYDSPTKLRKHVWAVHSEKKFVCDYCSKCFPAKTNLKSHIIAHMKCKGFVCDLCGLSFNFMSGLKDHTIRKHVPSKLYCKNCRRPFSTKQDYERHKCVNKQVLCPTCGKYYSSPQMKRHLMTHSGIAKYKCNICPAAYKSRGGLKVHMDKHDGNKTNQCEYCEAKFYYASTLIKHRRVHTGDKPYVCKICAKGFTGNYNLKVHMKVHGEYLINKKEKTSDTEILDSV